MGKYLSIVVPVLNEEGVVKKLHKDILEICQEIGRDFEIIFINDGSTDKTLEVMQTLSPIKIINFRKNFGQTAAMDAGIKSSQGDYIVTLDGDGQNDPADIVHLIDKLEKDNLDIVSGWRKNRKDTFFKKFFSRCAAMLRKKLIDDGIHDSGCSLKIYRRECFDHLDLVGEMHRFIPALLMIKGYKIGEIEVNHYPRTTGKTKYNMKRGVKGVLDMFSVWFWKKYANRPLHFFGGIGILLIIVSTMAGLLSIYKKIFLNQDLSDTALTQLCMVGFLTGIQFFVFGLLSDMMAKTYFNTTKDKIYDIKEVIENK